MDPAWANVLEHSGGVDMSYRRHAQAHIEAPSGKSIGFGLRYGA